MKKPEAAENLINYVDAEIMCGVWPPGTRLPSVRTLARKFGISYSSALRGIDYLAAAGKVRKSAKRGNFATLPQAAPGGGNALGILLNPGVTTPGIYASILAVINRLAAEYGYETKIFPCDMNTPAAAVTEFANRCAGVFLMRELDANFNELPINVPAVGVLLENDFQGRVSLVGLDPFNLALQAVDYFRRRGVKRVEAVTSALPIYRLRSRIFFQYWSDAGGEDGGTRLIDTGKVAVFPEVDPGRGYFFTSDNVAYVCMQAFAEANGVPITERAVMLSADGKSLIMPWEMRFPTVAVDWKEIGRVAFYECVGRIKDPFHKPRRIYLAGTLSRPDPRTLADYANCPGTLAKKT